MGNTNESLSNISAVDVEYLQVYQKLISMDFNEELSMKAAQKYPKNIEKAAEYVLKNQNKYTTNTNDGEIKEDEKYNDQKEEEELPLGEEKDYDIIKSGWVLKKGPQTLAGWKHRYIQLNSKKEIAYYTDESMQYQKGTVFLTELTVHHIKRSSKTSDSKHSGFCVVTANRTYQFCVQTATDRDDWIQNIRHIIDANYDSHNMEKQSISYSSNATLASKYSYNEYVNDEWDAIDEKNETDMTHNNFCDERIIIEGYLKKKSKHLRMLKRRWVILRGHFLCSYKKMYSDLTEPTETINLKLYNDIIVGKNNEFTLISCDSKNQSDRAFTGNSIDIVCKWVDAINPLLIPPTAPIEIVFERIKRICDNISDEIYEKCIKDLKESWHYRAMDLININEENNVHLWSKIPIILHDPLLKFITAWKKYDTFVQFEEPFPKYENFDELQKSKNIIYVLDALKNENQLNSCIMHIDILQQRIEELCVVNIDKFKLYCSKSEWNNINVPSHLKVILLNKIHHTFEDNENENENEQKQEEKVDVIDTEHVRDVNNLMGTLFNYNVTKVLPGSDYNNVDPTATMEHICELLSNSLFVEKERIVRYVQPLRDYKYHTIYHLTQISDTVYTELMGNVPKCVRFELYSLMEKCKETMNEKTFPFYECKEWTMETDKVFEILEQDLNLMKGELLEDCNILMNNFYSNLWDWFFVPESIWKSMPYYNTYEIVRIRINDLMTQCLNKYNINNDIILPELWLNGYNNELCLEQLLFGDLYNKDLSVNKLQFHFDGLNWNENTMKKIKLLYKQISKQEIFDENSINDMKENILMSQPLGQIMDDELEAELAELEGMEANELLNDNAAAQTSNSKSKTKPAEPPRNLVNPETVKDDFVKSGNEWVQFINDNAIPQHILFKIVFYCSKGKISDNDKWLNSYINKCNYPNLSTQYKQKILIPILDVENTTDVTAKIIFPAKLHLKCNVEISEESKESNWNDLVTIKMNQGTYLCTDLKRFTTYRLRARYKYHCKYTEIILFKTKLPQPPTFIIERTESISTTLRITSKSELQCEFEVMDEEQKETKWTHVTDSQLQKDYLDKNVRHLTLLKSNNVYQIRARYKDGLNVYSNYSTEKTLLTLPKPPAFSIQNILATQATFKVSNKSELTCHIELANDHALLNANWIELGNTISKEYLCTNLEPNNPYKIRAKYKNDTGFSQYSQIMSFTTKPMAPIFSVGNVVSTSATLSLSNWSYPLKCEVEIVEAGYSMWANWGTISQNSYLCKNLKDNYRYQIRARYKNDTGYSEYSSIKSFTTSPLPPLFLVKSITSDTVTISLSKKSELQCQIEIRPSIKQFGQITIPYDKTEYICTGLHSNRLYSIKARYKNKYISSAYSNPISFTTLPTAPCIGVTNVTDCSAVLTFPKLKHTTKLQCYVEIASKSKDYHSKTNWISAGNFSNKKKYVCRNLTYNHMYEIRCKYQNTTGCSQYSKVLSFKTKLPPPPAFSIDNVTSTTATLKFFNSMRTDLTCCVQIVNCYEQHNFKWTDLGTFSNRKTYTSVNLHRNTLYQIRAKYKGSNHRYTNALTFQTMDWSDILTQKEGDKLKKLINNHTRNQYKKQWKLLYRGSEHGFTSKAFYEKCEMQPNTICIIKTQRNIVFGAFTSIVWDKLKCKKRISQNDANAFLYLLRSNKKLQPAIFPVNRAGRNVIGNGEGSYLRFGTNNNSNASIFLSDNCNKNNHSKAYIFHKRDYYTFNVPKGYQLFNGKKFTVKEVEVYQLYEKTRRHRIGNKKRWTNEWIDRWTTDDVIHWINSIPQKVITDEWYYKILSAVKEYKCTGEDLMDLESVEDVGNAFLIESNQILCKYLFEKIKKFTEMLRENEMMNNIDWENFNNNNFGGLFNRVEPEEKFKCYLFSQERHVTLNEKVTKKTKVSHVKRLFKQQTGVHANIDDIHFSSKQQPMESNKTLEQCNIVDDRHLISVRFAAGDGKDYNPWRR